MRMKILALGTAIFLGACSQSAPSEETCGEVMERLENAPASEITEDDVKAMLLCEEALGREELQPFTDEDMEAARGLIK